jgi:hypothetical protein
LAVPRWQRGSRRCQGMGFQGSLAGLARRMHEWAGRARAAQPPPWRVLRPRGASR